MDEREKAVRKLTDNLKAAAQQNTNVINISYSERDPEAARDVLNRFIQAYLEKHLSVYCTADSQQFFERQVAAVAAKARRYGEAAIRHSRIRRESRPWWNSGSRLVAQIATLEQSITEAEAELVASDAKIAGIQKLLAAIPETVVLEESSGLPNYSAGTDARASYISCN